MLTVHAHPDDESSKGAGSIARYHALGARTVLVCCTGGEEGDVLNPAMDTPAVREILPVIRRQELAAAAAVIGYDDVVLLGYRDSGMPGADANRHPDSFAMAPLDEAVGRLVGVLRRVRPQVVVTYPAEQRGYPHPDHLKVHEVTVAAFEAAGDPSRYPSAGSPYAPQKLYYSAWSWRRMQAVHAKFLELGLASPFDEARLAEMAEGDHPVTTSIDVTGFQGVRRRALRAHATQVDPSSALWFGLPPEVEHAVHPYEDYFLARSLVGPLEGPEDDLFAGVGVAWPAGQVAPPVPAVPEWWRAEAPGRIAPLSDRRAPRRAGLGTR